MKSLGFLLPYFNDFSMQIWLLSVKWNILKLLLKNLGVKKKKQNVGADSFSVALVL